LAPLEWQVLIHIQVRVRAGMDEIYRKNEIYFNKARGRGGDGSNSSSIDGGKAMGAIAAADVPEED
jgi:hypothetical protein